MTFPPLDAPPPDHEPVPSAPPAPAEPLPRPPLRVRALTTALLAAASAAGAVLGFGIRIGMPARGFNAIAGVVLSDQARGIWGWDSRVTPVGIAVLVLAMAAWGALFARIAGTARGWRLIATAVAIAFGAWVVSTSAVVHRMGGDASRVLGPGQLVGLHLVLAVTLAVGMRFALRWSARSQR